MFETAMFLELMEKVRNLCHQNSVNHGFWDEKEIPVQGADSYKAKPWNFGEKIALIHSELSEMFEAYRKNIGDQPCDKDIRIIDPKYRNEDDTIGTRRITYIEEEVADVMIRLLDLCGKLDIDVGRAILAKMEYNKSRPYMHGNRKC